MRRFHWIRSAVACLALGVIGTPPALAWWNKDFRQRTQITLNTSAAGVETREALSGITIPVRLHSGNFDFVGARPDGSDLRVLAGDDKTPLKFTIERYDGTNELAVLWVQLPVVAPGSDQNRLYVYAGNDKAVAEVSAAVFDSATLAAFHFAEKDGMAADHLGASKVSQPIAVELNGQIGASARVDGGTIEWPAGERLQLPAGGAFSVSLWVRPEPPEGTLLGFGPLSLVLQAGRPVVRIGTLAFNGGELPSGNWSHLALSVGAGRATLYVNGTQAAQVPAPADLPALAGPLRIGGGLRATVDELQIANVARSADWVVFSRAAQAADARLVAAVQQTPESVDSAGGEAGYIGVLVNNLTVDAKVVIAILAVMFVVAVWVMVVKTLMILRVERGNRKFLEHFRAGTQDPLEKDFARIAVAGRRPLRSTLLRLYAAGINELRKRDVGAQGAQLSGASIDAIKAAVDADMVRETHRLNSQMVLLTIAISGGPFLGLLGTVVGVMITFAAIAAAGDVNVNAIAPGIAAALLATVAGLAVAIPALFGYNWLASRIKNLSAEMQIFVDEFVTRIAERYGAR